MLGLGIGLSKWVNYPANAIAQIINAFKSRVLADSGTFEADSCINSSITTLMGIDIYPIGDAAIIAFRTRILADSGTFEAYNCGIIAVQSLANIDL
jgi:hypothetical protein